MTHDPSGPLRGQCHVPVDGSSAVAATPHTPVSEIISRGWQACVPEVQWHIAVEVLVLAWLARAAPYFSDSRIWTPEPRQ